MNSFAPVNQTQPGGYAGNAWGSFQTEACQQNFGQHQLQTIPVVSNQVAPVQAGEMGSAVTTSRSDQLGNGQEYQQTGFQSNSPGMTGQQSAQPDPNQRQYCSQIYGQPGVGIHPGFDGHLQQQFSQPQQQQPEPKPIPVSVLPTEQKPRQLELDEELYLWLVDQTRQYPNYHQWSEEVCKDDRVAANTDLVTSVLMGEEFFQRLVAKSRES